MFANLLLAQSSGGGSGSGPPPNKSLTIIDPVTGDLPIGPQQPTGTTTGIASGGSALVYIRMQNSVFPTGYLPPVEQFASVQLFSGDWHAPESIELQGRGLWALYCVVQSAPSASDSEGGGVLPP